MLLVPSGRGEGGPDGRPGGENKLARKLTHMDRSGQAKMVAVASKRPSLRVAKAQGRIALGEEAYALAKTGNLPKGDLIAVARLAGILAAKSTPHLIPLCHPVALSRAAVDFKWLDRERTILVESFVEAKDVTGVEMEAMTSCAMACLSLYDMIKGVDRCAVIGPILLLEKTGGKSGAFRRSEHVHARA